MEEKVLESLKRRAKGYTVKEVVEEFVLGDDGDWQPVKRKVNKRDVPADVAAQRLYYEISGEDRGLTAEEVKREKKRLLKLLAECDEDLDK